MMLSERDTVTVGPRQIILVHLSREKLAPAMTFVTFRAQNNSPCPVSFCPG